jgi:hypothetical protein
MKRVAALILLAGGLSQAGTVNLVQTGWFMDGPFTGGPLTLSFAGEDLDLDGSITLPELTSFSAQFKTADGTVWEWSLPDIENDGFGFESPNSYFIRANSAVAGLYEFAGLGSYTAFVFGIPETPDTVYLSGNALQVVPEPGSAALLGLALFGVAVVVGKGWVSGRTATPRPAAVSAPPALHPSTR